MAKKDESGTLNAAFETIGNALSNPETRNVAFDKLKDSLKTFDDDEIYGMAFELVGNALFNPARRTETFGQLKNLLKTFDDDENYNAAVENLRTALANLGLKIIDDLNSKRVHKPEEVYNALCSIYNAIK